MQDLEVINRQNAKAVEEHVLKARDANKYGVAKYTGLNFHSFAEFDTEVEANEHAAKFVNDTVGGRSRVFSPEATAE